MKWEYYLDYGYYDMWAVRPEGDEDFNSPRLFHVNTMDEATRLVELLNNAKMAKYTLDRETT